MIPANDLIESTYDLRKALGSTLNLMRGLDPLHRERARTAPLRGKLVKQFGPLCAVCGAQGAVEAAHIVPLEIGGITEIDNLVLLCKNHHTAYDRGMVSIEAMRNIASAWRQGKQPSGIGLAMKGLPSRSPTVAKPPRGIEEVLINTLHLQAERKFIKAIAVVDEALVEGNLEDGARTYLLIKKAELSRRRAARGAIDEALTTLKTIDVSKVAVAYKPVFYYEYGYVLRLLGRHARAAEYMRKSAEAADEPGRGGKQSVAYVAAAVNEILCEIAHQDRLKKAVVKRLEARLSKLEKICSRMTEYWAGRWAMNCAAHKLQVRLKARDAAGSKRELRRVRDMYERMDASTGWDAGGRQTMSLLEGLARVMFPEDATDVTLGTSLLARSFVGRLGPRQRPEGARDVGFGLALGLRKSGIDRNIRHAEKIEAVAKRVVDGTSVIWPWKDNRA